MGKYYSHKEKNNIDIFINEKNDEPEHENFEDMEEIDNDIYVGIVIKRMKGYTCNLKINELDNLRENFWKIKLIIKIKISKYEKLFKEQ